MQENDRWPHCVAIDAATNSHGQDVNSVAAVNVRSVFCWLADFANGGQNSLLSKPIPGPIYLADESGIRSAYLKGTTWASAGETPVVEVTVRRFYLNIISAVSPQGEWRFILHDGRGNAEIFQEFLRHLVIGASGPVFLIVDGHPIHKAKLIKTLVEAQNSMFKLFFLPPYSPQLNPDERVWAHVKRKVARQFVRSKHEMNGLVLDALRRIKKLPALAKSFFQPLDCQYAAR